VRRLYVISILLCAATVLAQGQVIDTTRKINTWMLKHNFTRFEEVQLDTNMHQVQRDFNPAFKHGFSYESLGILGQGVNHVDFMLRHDPTEFLFGRAWEPNLKTVERTIFFNTRTPFTSLSYSTIPVKSWKEDNIEVIHTQNASPFTNFGIEFNILSSKELYLNQEARTTRAGLFGSHAKDRYSIFGTFYYNDINTGDNGGIANRDSFLLDVKDQWYEYEVNLLEANSHYRNLSLFTTQKYNLLERQIHTDSLGNTTTTGKTLSLSYQLMIERQIKDYEDVVDMNNLSPVYRNYYYLDSEARDSASEDKISNVLQLILGDSDYDKISARILAGHEFRRFGMLTPQTLHIDSLDRDTVVSDFQIEHFNDISLGFNLAGPTTGVWDWVIDGTYYLLGYNQNNFKLHSTFSRELDGKTDLGLRASLETTRPHYFTNRYSSSFFQWENDFPAMLRIKGDAFIQSENKDTDIRLGASYISNYIYWDEDAMPRLYDKDLLVFTAHMSRHFKLGGYHSETKLLVQYTTADEVLSLPLAVVYSSNYWDQSLFKGALIADLGFDVYYTTKYQASSYMPATGVFHLQNDNDLGGYPFLDVFIALHVKQTRLFATYHNVLQGVGFAGNNFFTAQSYPVKPRHFRLGIVWYFYD